MSKKKIRRPQQYQKPRDRTLKEWWGDQSQCVQRTFLYTGIALAAVIVLLLVWYYGVYSDGSLKVRANALVGLEDNWLVGELEKGKNSEYYHVADVGAPEGYEKSDVSAGVISSTSLRTDFTFRPVEDNGVTSIYVSVAGREPAAMIESVYPTFQNFTAERGDVSEVGEMETEYGEGRYFSYHVTYDDGEGGTEYDQALVLYVPCAYRNACVMISVNVLPESEEGYLDAETLLDTALLTLEQVEITAKP